MQTKLTLRLEDNLIARAKDYSKRSGKSLSEVVADYFAHLEKPAPVRDLPPVTSALKGLLKPASLDRKDYRDYLADKYL
jgi:hypothetical protein